MPDHRVRATSTAVIRASALLAVAGGALRVTDSFTTDVWSAGTLALLYLLTDVLLLAGVAGLWWWRRGLGRAGTAGIAIFVAGTLVIRVSASADLGTGGYQVGAVLALIGLAAYSIETLVRRGAARWAPVLWLASLACAVAGALGVAPLVLTTAAGVTFGAGFASAGVEMLLSPLRPRVVRGA